MKPTPVFAGVIKNGKLNLKQRDKFMEYLKKLEGDVDVSVKLHKLSRSDKQRKYWWAVVIPAVQQFEGLQDEDEANEHLKFWYNPRVIHLKDGKEEKVGMSIEHEKTNKVEAICSQILKDYSTVGLFIPKPNETQYNWLDEQNL